MTSTSDRILQAAAGLTSESGWASLTMAQLATRVGVSRQTVYNEFGSKQAIAEAMVLRELAAFLAQVEAAFDAHPTDLVAAIGAATRNVLEFAAGNQLLKAVVSATNGADTELLPLLTTNAEPLLTTAHTVIAARVATYSIKLPAERLDAAIDMVVRVVLSHVMQPSATPAETADNQMWLAARVLGA